MMNRSHERIIEAQFGPRATPYVTSAVHASGADLDRMAAIVGQQTGATAIDVGCGGGHAAFRLAPLVSRVVACDLSAAMLAAVQEEAKRRNLDNLVTARGNVEDLEYPPSSFDVAVTRYSAHHWRDARRGIVRMRRALKPGALAVFMDVISPGSPLLDTWLQAVEILRDPSHVRDYSLAEWFDMLAAAGFAPTELATYRLRLEFAAWIERMKTDPAHVAAIRSMQRAAAADVARHFSLESDGTFTVDTMLIAARARGGDATP